MAGPRWILFIGVALAATVAVVWATRATASLLVDGWESTTEPDGPPPGSVELLLNLGASHAVVLAGLLGVAWYGHIPTAVLGLGGADLGRELVLGVWLGLGLAGGNEAIARWLDRHGVGLDERLRRWLAPATPMGWVLLLAAVLPVVATAEELLFRAALIGVPAAAYGLPPWLLVLAAAVPFGLAHGIQGRAGVLVATGLGVALGAAFVVTASLPVVVVAHAVVNAIEFLHHEAFAGG